MAEIASQIITGSFTLGAGVLTYIGTVVKQHSENKREDRTRFVREQHAAAGRVLTAATSLYDTSLKAVDATDPATVTKLGEETVAAINEMGAARDAVKLLFPPEGRTQLDKLLERPIYVKLKNEAPVDQQTRRDKHIKDFWAAVENYSTEVRLYLKLER